MGAGRGGGRGGEDQPWAEVEGQAAERVSQCQVFLQGFPDQELEESQLSLI